ncbi:MAG: amidohydrolase [Luminiphilus sp.]|nr:amidohydrolase [Luminiphilus sp.]
MLKIVKCSADKRWPASIGCIFATVLCVSAAVAGAQEDCPESDLLLINANIYTGGDDNTSHEALAIKDGVFSFIGSNDAASRWVCGAKQVVSLDGSTVFPGFTDSHQHLEGIGRRTKTLSLFGTNNLEQTVTEIERWAAQIPAGQWVLGRGWIEREWVGERRFLTRWDVDPFTESKPLFMPRADGVSALVNSKALILAGITRETPDPAGGRFDRNNEGELTGYVLGNAMEPFRNLIPADTDAYVKDNLRRGMAVNAARGWTSTHDAGMSWRELRLLQELRYEGAMAHRVYVAVPIAQAGPLLEQGAEYSDDGLIDLGGVKVFIDGTLGSRGAALLEPYTDANHNGFMNRTTKAELMPVLEGALRNGLQILTHVIGDRAVSVTLDWYQEAWDALPRSDWQREDLRWRLEHAQIIRIKDQQRLQDMNVIASMQPSHAIGDLNFAPARLGLERLQFAYPWQPLLERGIKIVAGSDAPVEAGDPRIEFYAAITRQRLDGTSGAGWHPEYAVSREDALRMFTLWPAYSTFQEERRGSISVGKQADLSIFDTDFLRAKPAAILTAKTVMTVVNGRIAYVADRSTDTPN